MKRIVLWLLSTVSAVVLLFGYHTSTSGPAATAQAPVGASLSTTGTTTSSGSGAGGGSDGTDGGTTTTGEYPSGNGEDQRINSYALPRLVQETLDAQSADVDMVSGATVTSEGYLQSLQSALDAVSA